MKIFNTLQNILIGRRPALMTPSPWNNEVTEFRANTVESRNRGNLTIEVRSHSGKLIGIDVVAPTPGEEHEAAYDVADRIGRGKPVLWRAFDHNGNLVAHHTTLPREDRPVEYILGNKRVR